MDKEIIENYFISIENDGDIRFMLNDKEVKQYDRLMSKDLPDPIQKAIIKYDNVRCETYVERELVLFTTSDNKKWFFDLHTRSNSGQSTLINDLKKAGCKNIYIHLGRIIG